MKEDIEAIIDSVVRDRLADARIQRVVVEEDEDSEGDRVFRIMVVFDATRGKLEAHRISGLARHLRSRLETVNEFAYPIFRFVSEADARKIVPAAA